MLSDRTGIKYYKIGILGLGHKLKAHISQHTAYKLAVRFVLLAAECDHACHGSSADFLAQNLPASYTVFSLFRDIFSGNYNIISVQDNTSPNYGLYCITN